MLFLYIAAVVAASGRHLENIRNVPHENLAKEVCSCTPPLSQNRHGVLYQLILYPSPISTC